MKIEIKENVQRPAWTSRSLDGKAPGKAAVSPKNTRDGYGTTLGLDNTLESEKHEHNAKSA